MTLRKFILLCANLLLTPFALAQFTTVSGTVTDPNGLPYAFGTVVPVLVTSASPTLNGGAYTPPIQPVGLDSTGSFTMRLADNTVLLPAATKWNFTVCSAVGTVQPAGGKGSVCFSLATPITISGTSQSITTNLNAVALALTTPTTATACSTCLTAASPPAAHLPLLGSGTNAVSPAASAGNSGAPFLSGGVAADGAYGALNLAGGSTIVTGNLPSANGGACALSGAGAGGFFGVAVTQDNAGPTEAASTIVSANNENRVVSFFLPCVATVTKISFQIATVQAGSTGDVGIYCPLAGNSNCTPGALLLNTGGFQTANNAAAPFSGSIGTIVIAQGTVTLKPGWYVYAQTNSNSAVTMRAWNAFSAAYNIMNANTTKRVGTADAATAGVLPNAITAITGSNANTVQLSYFSND